MSPPRPAPREAGFADDGPGQDADPVADQGEADHGVGADAVPAGRWLRRGVDHRARPDHTVSAPTRARPGLITAPATDDDARALRSASWGGRRAPPAGWRPGTIEVRSTAAA